jgi:hypothetical protein
MPPTGRRLVEVHSSKALAMACLRVAALRIQRPGRLRRVKQRRSARSRTRRVCSGPQAPRASTTHSEYVAQLSCFFPRACSSKLTRQCSWLCRSAKDLRSQFNEAADCNEKAFRDPFVPLRRRGCDTQFFIKTKYLSYV